MLKIFNTLTKKKEIFKTFIKKQVNIYICGISTSDYCHIGHGRTFYFFDILIKYLIYLGYKCNYIRNITDVNEKIISKSINNNIILNKLSFKMINNMYKDFENLGFDSPCLEPKISDNINLIIKSILILLKYKFAYISLNGDILFSYKNFYNKNKNFIFKSRKKFFYSDDFVLWKKNKLFDNIGWNSPWGFGRPGWHIQCSSISNKYLNNVIDIHGGGSDLIIPHHENELILSKCLLGNNYNVKYWMHTGLIINNKIKLSKSKNNCFLIKDLIKLYSSDVIKYYLIMNHYRKKLYFDYKLLNLSKLAINRFNLCLDNFNLKLKLSKNDLSSFREFDDYFFKNMNNDFNLPKIQQLLFVISKEIFKFKNKNFLLANKLGIKMKFFTKFLGLLNNTNKVNLDFNLIKKINNLIKLRNLARKNENWKQADNIRNKLYKLNIILHDKKNFVTKWYFS